MITWANKIAFVGMVVEHIPQQSPDCDNDCRYNLRVRIPDGLCSYGNGETMEEALEDAAWGMNMDWWSVERNMTEREWQRMAHT
jgi:hypothetical protein